jgi:hypothetical protein
MTRVPFIPNPCDTDRQFARWLHRDLEGEALDPRRLWAEVALIEHELARRLVGGRPRIVHIDPNGTPVNDQAWLEARARRLRGALHRATRGA